MTVEVASHMGDNVVRAISLGPTDGLQRGMEASDTGAPLTVPVGRPCLGRLMNVLGEPKDERGPIESEGSRADSSRGSCFCGSGNQAADF